MELKKFLKNNNNMEIRVKDLLEIINILSNKIENSFDSTIEVKDEKYFWEIPEDRIFDVFNDIPQLLIGDISEDWNELLRLKNNNETPISYDIKRLSMFLQLIRNNSRSIW